LNNYIFGRFVIARPHSEFIDIAMHSRPSVCCLCPSHAGLVRKRLNIVSNSFQWRMALTF